MSIQKTIDLDTKQMTLVKDILKKYVPNKTVWAYGSRVDWKANERSDLDLVVFNTYSGEVGELREEFAESELLISVDVMDWETIPEDFKENIQEKYVVLQEESKLSDSWQEVKLGDILKSNQQSIDQNYPHKVIQYLDTGSITEGRIESLQILTLHEAPSRARRLVKNSDIIYSIVRPIQRHYGFIKNPPENLVVSTGFSVLETQKSKANPLFVYYLLTTKNVVEKFDAIAEGATSTYPSLKPNDIENLKFLLPPLPEQKAIAEILSSLDDKIDLLHRQNKTLENLARTLFRKWFIDNSDRSNWEQKPLEQVFDFLEGPGIRNWQYTKKGTRFMNIRLIANGEIAIIKSNFISDEEANGKYKHFQLQEKDMVVSTSGTLGKIAIVRSYHLPLVLNTSIIRFRPKDKKDYSFMYQYLQSREFQTQMDSLGGGSVQTNFGPTHLRTMKLQMPPEELFKTFQSNTDCIYEKISNIYEQIHKLERLRDVLLPKLMNGKIRIE